MNDIDHTTLIAYLTVIAAILSLSFSAIFVSWASAPGAVTAFYRMAIAVVALAGPFYFRGRRNGLLRTPVYMSLRRRDVQFAMLGGALFAVDMFLWNTGVLLSGAVNPTLMGNIAPVWVGLGAYFLFGEQLNVRFWGGLALAVCGAGLILGVDALQQISLGIGTLLGLVAGIFYGGYFLATQRGREGLDAVSYFWLAAVNATIVSLLLALLLDQPLFGYSARTYLSFLGLGLVSQALGQLLFNYALGHLPASIVSPMGLIQPVVTALLAVPLLGQPITVWQVIGGSAVLAGVFIVQISRRRRRKLEPAEAIT